MSIDGLWNITLHTPMGAQDAKITFSSADNTLSGSIEFMGNNTEVFDGTVNGDAAEWKTKITSPVTATVEFSGKLDGDQITGIALLKPFGRAKFEGSKA